MSGERDWDHLPARRREHPGVEEFLRRLRIAQGQLLMPERGFTAAWLATEVCGGNGANAIDCANRAAGAGEVVIRGRRVFWPADDPADDPEMPSSVLVADSTASLAKNVARIRATRADDDLPLPNRSDDMTTEARRQRMDQIRALLADGPLTANQVAKRLRVSTSTANNDLAEMEGVVADDDWPKRWSLTTEPDAAPDEPDPPVEDEPAVAPEPRAPLGDSGGPTPPFPTHGINFHSATGPAPAPESGCIIIDDPYEPDGREPLRAAIRVANDRSAEIATEITQLEQERARIEARVRQLRHEQEKADAAVDAIADLLNAQGPV